MAKHELGPVQALVVGFEDPDFSGRILQQLRRVRKRGVIRVVDLLFVEKAPDGTIASTMHKIGLSEAERICLGGLIGSLIGLEVAGLRGASEGVAAGELRLAKDDFGMNTDQLAELAERIPAGSDGALLIIEHHWAAKLRDAIVDAGGTLLVHAMLGADLMVSIGRELEARLEAEAAIEEAEAVKLAASMEVAQVLAEAELVEEAAMAEAAEVVVTALARADATAQEAVDALVQAQLIEDAAAEHAAVAVAEALVVEAAAAEETEAAVEAARDIKAAAAIVALRAIYAAEVIGDEAARAAIDALVAADIIQAEAAADSVDAVVSAKTTASPIGVAASAGLGRAQEVPRPVGSVIERA